MSSSFVENTLYEIYTDQGFKNFDGIKRSNNIVWKLILVNGETLDCTPNHELYEKEMKWTRLDRLCEGDLVFHNQEYVEIKDIIQSENEDDVFDAIGVEDTESYYTNNTLSHNCSMLYIDECAFIPNDFEFYESTYPVVSSGKNSRVIITSTPKGARGLFYKLWTEAEEKNNEFVTNKVIWSDVPNRDQEWKEQTIRNSSLEQFNQEHECHFMGSSGTLIESSFLQTIPIRNAINKVNNVDIFKEPVEGHEYVITVDTARGVGGDSSAFVVFDISQTPYDIVAKFKCNEISPLIYPTPIFNTAQYYNNAFVLVEINDIGEQVASILYHDLEYDCLLMVTSKGSRGQQISTGFGGGTSDRLGIRTTAPVKTSGCSNIKTLIEKEQITINDLDIISEMGTFISKGKSYAADEGCHDDLMMCLVLFGWLSQQDWFKEMSEDDVREKILKETEERIYEDLTPFGFFNTGLEEDEEEEAFF